MPLFDFHCSSGHVTEKLAPFATEVISCACGEPARRAEVNRILFGFKGANGEKVSTFYEAASEAKHTYESTDDPAAKAATRPDIWRPAWYRARNALNDKVIQGADSDSWADPQPGKSAKEAQSLEI